MCTYIFFLLKVFILVSEHLIANYDNCLQEEKIILNNEIFMATTCTVILSFRTENELVFLFYRALHKWWAQYMESTGDMENALQYYENAQDYLSLVRVYCYCGQMDKVSFLLFPTLPVTDQLVIHTYNSLFWSEYMSLFIFFTLFRQLRYVTTLVTVQLVITWGDSMRTRTRLRRRFTSLPGPRPTSMPSDSVK